MVSTETAGDRPVLVLGSPLDPGSTDLPISTQMLPLVEWIVAGWPPTFRVAEGVTAGSPLELPSRATGVRIPDGTVHPVDGRQPFRETGSPGIYEVLDGDSVLTRAAVNAPPWESLLERLDPETALLRIPAPARMVDGPDDWTRRVFLERRGRELWRPLLLTVLLLLVCEGLLAAGGGAGRRAERKPARSVSANVSE